MATVYRVQHNTITVFRLLYYSLAVVFISAAVVVHASIFCVGVGNQVMNTCIDMRTPACGQSGMMIMNLGDSCEQ